MVKMEAKLGILKLELIFVNSQNMNKRTNDLGSKTKICFKIMKLLMCSWPIGSEDNLKKEVSEMFTSMAPVLDYVFRLRRYLHNNVD